MQPPNIGTEIEIEVSGKRLKAYVVDVEPMGAPSVFRTIKLRVSALVTTGDKLLLIDEIGASKDVGIRHVSSNAYESIVTVRLRVE